MPFGSRHIVESAKVMWLFSQGGCERNGDGGSAYISLAAQLRGNVSIITTPPMGS